MQLYIIFTLIRFPSSRQRSFQKKKKVQMRSHAKKLYTNKKHTKKPKVKAKNILKKIGEKTKQKKRQ